MAEANEGRRSKAMDDLSLQMDKYPRDLLQRFMACSNNTQQSLYSKAREESEEVELSLGLSLGGRFGVDKNARKLMRSSSIVGTMPFAREDVDSTTPSPALARVHSTALMRTSSLPVETEEQWRKRKEMQTLRRMEAKRRRSDKQRNSKTERDGGSGGAGGEEEVVGGATVSLRPVGLPSWGASSACNARQVQVILDVLAKGKVGFHGYAQPSSQGSADSQGGSSSGMSEMESKTFQGSNSCGEARSPVSNHPLQEQSKQDSAGSSGTMTNDIVIRTSSVEPEYPSKKPDPSPKRGREREIGINSMDNMPCVFAKGDGPNGRRIEGILYRYGRGEEVRIMCVCHGNLLSPAEFVKHAGGGDVSHPLRHIVVNPVHL